MKPTIRMPGIYGMPFKIHDIALRTHQRKGRKAPPIMGLDAKPSAADNPVFCSLPLHNAFLTRRESLFKHVWDSCGC